MNKHAIAAALGATAILTALAACTDNPGAAPKESSGYAWVVVQSPLTHRCYEIASHNSGFGNISYSSGGMAEVPCSELKRNKSD